MGEWLVVEGNGEKKYFHKHDNGCYYESRMEKGRMVCCACRVQMRKDEKFIKGKALLKNLG